MIQIETETPYWRVWWCNNRFNALCACRFGPLLKKPAWTEL